MVVFYLAVLSCGCYASNLPTPQGLQQRLPEQCCMDGVYCAVKHAAILQIPLIGPCSSCAAPPVAGLMF